MSDNDKKSATQNATERFINEISEKANLNVKTDNTEEVTTEVKDKKDKEQHLEKRIHSNWLADYIKYTQFQESPTLFHLWNGISQIAAVLNRNVYIQRGYNRLYPNLYVVLVSRSGRSKKTTSANIGVNNFLQQIDGIRILRDEATPKGLITFLEMAPVDRVGTRIVQNCTGFVYATELSDLLGEQSYNQGLIKKLTALYDCPDIYEDSTKEILKKDKRPVRLTNVCVNFLGCSNPEWLAHGLKEDSFGGGFMGRILFIYSSEVNKTDESAWMEVPPDIAPMGITLLKDLQRIAKLKGVFNVTAEAKKHFIKLYKSYDGDFSGRMAGYLERKLTYALKLSMILSVNFDDKLIITKQHIDAALSYLDNVEKVMPDAFVYINATNEARISQHIIEAIREGKGAIYRSVLVEKFRHLVRNIREFDDILQMLIEARIIKPIINQDNEIIYIFQAVFEQKQKEAAKKLLEESGNNENSGKETVQ